MTSSVDEARAPRPAPATTLPALTGLRFLAALWVMTYHYARPWLTGIVADDAAAAVGGGAVGVGAVARNLLLGAPLALTTFFALSGFVLTFVYGRSTLDRPLDRPLDRRAYAVARIARILPGYWLAVAVAIPLGIGLRASGFVDDGYASLLFVATATQAWMPGAALEWNAPLWSVSVEVAFYCAFPLLLPLVMRASRRALVVAGAAAWCASVAAGAAYCALDPDGLGVVDVESAAPWLHVLRFNPIARLPELLLGMIGARLFLDGARVSKRAGAAACAAAVVVVAAGVVPSPLMHGALLAPAAVIVLLALATSDGPIAQALSSAPLQRLGDASYALYALHVPVCLWLMAFTRTRLDALTVPFVVVAAAVVVAVSLGAHAFWERPMRERIRRRLAR